MGVLYFFYSYNKWTRGKITTQRRENETHHVQSLYIYYYFSSLTSKIFYTVHILKEIELLTPGIVNEMSLALI